MRHANIDSDTLFRYQKLRAANPEIQIYTEILMRSNANLLTGPGSMPIVEGMAPYFAPAYMAGSVWYPGEPRCRSFIDAGNCNTPVVCR